MKNKERSEEYCIDISDSMWWKNVYLYDIIIKMSSDTIL